MKYNKNILETIGDTTLNKLNKISNLIESSVFVKVESFNHCNSV